MPPPPYATPWKITPLHNSTIPPQQHGGPSPHVGMQDPTPHHTHTTPTPPQVQHGGGSALQAKCTPKGGANMGKLMSGGEKCDFGSPLHLTTCTPQLPIHTTHLSHACPPPMHAPSAWAFDGGEYPMCTTSPHTPPTHTHLGVVEGVVLIDRSVSFSRDDAISGLKSLKNDSCQN